MLYFVSTASVGNYVTNKVWYVESYASAWHRKSKSVQTAVF